jgi:hypothetical protein
MAQSDDYRDEKEKQPDVPGKSVRTIAASLSVVAILVLSTLFYFVFLYPFEESEMTMTELVEKANDRNGDGIPDDYFPYADGDTVIVRDTIAGAQISSFEVNESYTAEWVYLEFSYNGRKWKAYYQFGISVTLLDVSLCSYGLGDWIRLKGMIREYVMGGHQWETIDWTLADEDERPHEPWLELTATQVSPKKWGIVVSGCEDSCKLLHYEIILRKYGFGWDWMEPPGHGTTTRFLEFWDLDKDGYLSAGDKIYVEVEDEGEYTVEIYFHDREMASVAFTCEGP